MSTELTSTGNMFSKRPGELRSVLVASAQDAVTKMKSNKQALKKEKSALVHTEICKVLIGSWQLEACCTGRNV